MVAPLSSNSFAINPLMTTFWERAQQYETSKAQSTYFIRMQGSQAQGLSNVIGTVGSAIPSQALPQNDFSQALLLVLLLVLLQRSNALSRPKELASKNTQTAPVNKSPVTAVQGATTTMAVKRPTLLNEANINNKLDKQPTKLLNLLLEGDSLTWSRLGYGPTLSKLYAKADPAVSISNNAGDGHTLSGNMLPEAAANAAKLDKNKDNIIVLYGGTNDMYFGAKGDPTYENLKKTAQTYKDKGWKVLIVTATQRGDTQDAERLKFNNHIRADEKTGPWDMVLDLGSFNAFLDTNNAASANKAVYADTVHLTAKGNQMVADAIQSAVEQLRA